MSKGEREVVASTVKGCIVQYENHLCLPVVQIALLDHEREQALVELYGKLLRGRVCLRVEETVPFGAEYVRCADYSREPGLRGGKDVADLIERLSQLALGV